MNIQSHGAIHFKNWDNSYIPNILHEIYLQQIYKQFLSGQTELTLFDLGLNIGLWSMYASRYAKNIYAFEPAKETFDIAVKNLTENKFTNVHAFQQAVSTKDSKTTFYHSTNSTMNSLNSLVNNTGEKEEVETIRLDTFVKREKIDHIDFAKIDVEGHESKLFASEGFKNIASLLDSFVYEWHSWTESSPSVINFGLKELGFMVFPIPSDATLFGARKV